MGKLNLTVDLDNLTEKEREEFFELVEKSKKKSLNPFERVKKGTLNYYYHINAYNQIESKCETNNAIDNYHFECCNYFNNKEFAEHQALRELLNRKLMKFSYENGGADIDYSSTNPVCAIFYSLTNKKVEIISIHGPDILTPIFISYEVAQRAIDEVIKPFMEEHPDFKWWG